MLSEKVQRVLDKHGLNAMEFEEGSTPTAPLAAEKLKVSVGQIAKSILMKGKDGACYMVIAPGDRKISTSKLKTVIGSKARMATPQETLEVTGYTIGGVCPFAVKNVPILLDAGLREFETVYPAAGTSSSGVPVAPEKLAEITGGSFYDLTMAPEQQI